jgi:disulfide bond formation protein DsbB
MPVSFRPVPSALAIALIGAAAILGAYFFQYVIKLAPCPLCLEQRIPYYIGIPLALVVAFAASRRAPPLAIELGFMALVLVFLYGAGLGIYHAGIEWKFWTGPTECTGTVNPFGGSGDLLSQIQNTSVVRCDEAAWRLFGLSLAGYNAIVSVLLAIVAFCAARPGPSRSVAADR